MSDHQSNLAHLACPNSREYYILTKCNVSIVWILLCPAWLALGQKKKDEEKKTKKKTIVFHYCYIMIYIIIYNYIIIIIVPLLLCITVILLGGAWTSSYIKHSFSYLFCTTHNCSPLWRCHSTDGLSVQWRRCCPIPEEDTLASHTMLHHHRSVNNTTNNCLQTKRRRQRTREKQRWRANIFYQDFRFPLVRKKGW